MEIIAGTYILIYILAAIAIVIAIAVCVASLAKRFGRNVPGYLVLSLLITPLLVLLLLVCLGETEEKKEERMENEQLIIQKVLKKIEGKHNLSKKAENAKTAMSGVPKEEIETLKKLINKEKNKSIFANSISNEIIDCLENQCKTREEALSVIKEYNAVFNSNLIDDLKKLSTSYEKIKNFVGVFIEFEIVEEKYPHYLKVEN